MVRRAQEYEANDNSCEYHNHTFTVRAETSAPAIKKFVPLTGATLIGVSSISRAGLFVEPNESIHVLIDEEV